MAHQVDRQDRKCDADTEFGHPDPRLVREQPAVARAGEKTTPGDRRPVDRGDRRQRALEDPEEGGLEGVEDRVRGVGEDLVDVQTRREDLALAGEHERGDIRILLAVVDNGDDLVQCRFAE